MVAKKRMRSGGMMKTAAKKKMMRGGGMAKTAKKRMMRGGMAAKKKARQWHKKLARKFPVNVSVDPEFTKRMLTSVTNLKRTSAKYFGWGLLYMGKPFTAVGNWFWKRHRAVLDWGNK